MPVLENFKTTSFSELISLFFVFHIYEVLKLLQMIKLLAVLSEKIVFQTLKPNGLLLPNGK